MTVTELVEALQKMPPQAEVFHSAIAEDADLDVREVSLQPDGTVEIN